MIKMFYLIHRPLGKDHSAFQNDEVINYRENRIKIMGNQKHR